MRTNHKDSRGSRTNQKGGQRVGRGPTILTDGEARANHHRVSLRRPTRFWKPPFPATAGLLVTLLYPNALLETAVSGVSIDPPGENLARLDSQSPNYRLPTPRCVAGRRSEPAVSGPIIRTMRGSRSNQRVDGGDGGGGEDQSAFSTVLNRRVRRSEPAGGGPIIRTVAGQAPIRRVGSGSGEDQSYLRTARRDPITIECPFDVE